jgi:hypothetical protein
MRAGSFGPVGRISKMYWPSQKSWVVMLNELKHLRNDNTSHLLVGRQLRATGLIAHIYRACQIHGRFIPFFEEGDSNPAEAGLPQPAGSECHLRCAGQPIF